MKTSFLPEHPGLPLVVRARRSLTPADLAPWMAEVRTELEALLHHYGALLFRGLPIEEAPAFEQFAGWFGKRLSDYVRGTSPRSRVHGQVFTSTDAPAFLPIPLHCEMSYADDWPAKVLFYCKVPPRKGGATPIADMRRVLEDMDPDKLRRFEAHGLRFVQNIRPRTRRLGFRGWIDMFQTEDREAIARLCDAQGIRWSWHGDILRLVKQRPAVIRHPVTGVRVWFNAATTFHDSWSSELRRARLPLLAAAAAVAERWRRLTLDPEDFPRHALLGDGSPIPRADLEHVRDLMHRHTVAFPWERHDVLVIDNAAVAHAREPFRGPRRILAALVPRDVEQPHVEAPRPRGNR